MKCCKITSVSGFVKQTPIDTITAKHDPASTVQACAAFHHLSFPYAGNAAKMGMYKNTQKD
jgi:hypothetical protein